MSPTLTLLGATGETGRHVLSSALSSSLFSSIHSLGRRHLPLASPTPSSLKETTVDFEALLSPTPTSATAEANKFVSPPADTVIVALGTTRTAVGGSMERFVRVDREYVVAGARAARVEGEGERRKQRLVYCSSAGTRLRRVIPYNQSKWLTENELARLGYDEAIIFRPRVIQVPNGRSNQHRPIEAFSMTISNAISTIFPDVLQIPSPVLGRAMVRAAELGVEGLEQMTTMEAARFYGNQDLRVERVEVPELRQGEVRVKVAFAGICGSDLHEYYGGPMTCTSHPHKLTGEAMPVSMGHEFSGVVDAVGEGVDTSRLAMGTKVCIEPVISCRSCRYCQANLRPLCDQGIGFYGYNTGGGLASYANVAQANVHVVPDNISLDVAALAEPLSVAWHAVRQSGFKAGDSALVIGAGPIGLAVTRVLKALSASSVFVSEPSPSRSSLATTSGADAVYNPLEVDVVAAVKEATEGGCDVSFDCAGTQRTFEASLRGLRKRGRAVMVALWEKPAAVDLNDLIGTEISLTASCCFESRDMVEVLEALGSGKIKVDDLITAKILLKDVVEKGIEALKNEQHHVKILVDLEASARSS